MGLSRRHAGWLRVVFSLLLVTAFLSSSVGIALASTNGVLSGTVKDSAGHPLADVHVTAASPSGSYSATTNGSGFYSMTGVYADTYTVSFQLSSYQPISVPGVTVFADQVSALNETMVKSLKTIATVRSHSVSSAYQPNQTTDTVTVGAQQIQQFQGSSFNSSETNLLTSLPGATADASGYPVIHGGREYEEGFQFEGIPYIDAYSNQFTNTLAIPTAGIGLVQLTPGGGDITQGTGGGFGTFNVVAKRGTYPAYGNLGVAVGSPSFDHRLNFDWSWATPDGRFSNYLSMANSNFAPQYQTGGLPYAAVGRFFSDGYETDRETLDNFVYRFGNNKSQSLQLFFDVADHHFYQDAGGNGANVSCSVGSLSTYNTLCFPNADPNFRRLWSTYLSYGALIGLPGWTGLFSRAEVSAITPLFPGQTSPTESLAQASNRASRSYFQPNTAFKIGYSNNLNSSTFFNLTAYRTNAVVTFDWPGEEDSYANDVYIGQGGMTDGLTLSLQKQLSDKHLLEAGADISHLHPVDYYRSISLAFFGSTLNALGTGAYDELYLPAAFIPSGMPCPIKPRPGASSGSASCGYAYNAYPAGTTGVTFPMFDQISTVNRQDYSLYLSDKWTPNTRLNAQIGVRMDAATYRVPTPGVDPYYCTSLYTPKTWTPNPNYNPANPMGGTNCPFNATFDFPNDSVRPKVIQPRAGISYRLGSDSAIRLTYSRAVQFVPIGSVDYGETDPRAYFNTYGKLAPFDPGNVGTYCGYAGFQVPCRNFGEQLYWANQNMDGVAYQLARPTTSDNYQLSLQHVFTGKFLNGVALNLAPWYRNQHDTIAQEASPILDQHGNPLVVNGAVQFQQPILTNAGKEHAVGIDFNLARTVPFGLSYQLTASYINEFSSVIPLSGGEDFYPSVVPQSLELGNEYRVGFVSPFQTTLALSYHTQNGWRITPRYSWNIGYPTGLGQLTAAYINGVAYNVPNTNGVGAGGAPAGAACFIDPTNPGSQFNPNLAACRGNAEAAAAGGKLSPQNSFTDLTLEYAPPKSNVTIGLNVNNIFNQTLSGAQYNSRYAPLATGITGPLTGYSTSSSPYPTTSGCSKDPTVTCSFLSSLPLYGSYMRGQQSYINVPNQLGRTFYLYLQVKV